jgi:putative transposase
MKARYRFRLYPHPHQCIALARMFGCTRRVWNDALAHCQELRAAGEKTPSGYALRNRMVGAKAEVPWLAAAPSTPLCESVLDLAVAYRNFWASCTGKRKGPKVEAPRFKSKRDSRQAARFTQQAFRCHERTLQLQKIGKVPIKWSRDLPAEPSSCTVIRDASGRYFASFVVEVAGATTCAIRPQDGRCVGIDLGLASLATTSDGEKVPFSRHFDGTRKRLRRLQRSLSRRDRTCTRTNPVTGRRQTGSHRYHRRRLEIARLHAKVADQRTNGLHQLTSRLVRDHDFIAIEDLNVSAMLKAPKPVRDEAAQRWLPNGRASKRGLARAIADAGWRAFRTMLEQKADRAGKRVMAVNPAYTSQRCNRCGHTEKANRPKQDTFRCQSCGHTDHADINAARNILAAGLAVAGRGASCNPLLAGDRGVVGESSEASTQQGSRQLCLF